MPTTTTRITAALTLAVMLTACSTVTGTSIEPIPVTTFPPDIGLADNEFASAVALGVILEANPALAEAHQTDQQTTADMASIACGAANGTETSEEFQGAYKAAWDAYDSETQSLVTNGFDGYRVVFAALLTVYCPDVAP